MSLVENHELWNSFMDSIELSDPPVTLIKGGHWDNRHLHTSDVSSVSSETQASNKGWDGWCLGEIELKLLVFYTIDK